MTPDERNAALPAHLRARYDALEQRWAELGRAQSWHSAWGLANALAALSLTVGMSFAWPAGHVLARGAMLLLVVVSMGAQCAVWWRGARARQRVLRAYEACNEALRRHLGRGD